jgi:hypothetical protein
MIFLIFSLPTNKKKVLGTISKPDLTPDGCVDVLFKMLTYFPVCCAFSSALALPSAAISDFETALM